jgi:hypothetical protein
LIKSNADYGLWPIVQLSSMGETNVRKPLSASRVALLALGVLSLLGSAAYGQDRDRSDDGRRDNDRRDEVRGDEHPNGIVQDWSHRHLVYPRVGPIHNLIAIQHDQRALFSWQDSWRREWRRGRNPWRLHRSEPMSQIDWSIPLGAGTTAQDMFPAKFTFDKNATPLCASDFVVFAVNATAGAAQPNLVAFNNLYSGTAGSTGICNAPADGRTASVGVDDGVSATTLWSYSIKAAGGQVSTSPALSLDGTKVAFVETAAATTAHFHVLAWRTGDGVPTNLQAPATAPLQITSGFDANAPVAASGSVTDLALVVAGNSGGGSQVVVQASTVDLSNARVATLNPGGLFNLHAPAFNEAYLSGTGTPLLYEMGSSATSGGEFTLFGITFGALDVMNTGTPANVQNFVFGAFELSPMTEFFDGTTDRLFESTIGAGASLAEFNITTTFPTAPVGTPPSEGTGTTGIIVDNAASTTNQAESIYFGVLGSNTAVKLTQAGLQ